MTELNKMSMNEPDFVKMNAHPFNTQPDTPSPVITTASELYTLASKTRTGMQQILNDALREREYWQHRIDDAVASLDALENMIAQLAPKVDDTPQSQTMGAQAARPSLY